MGWVNDIAIFTLKTASTFQGGATYTAFLSFLVNVETFLNKVFYGKQYIFLVN